jgi:catechol 2,3-dioxygenase-like lactoylglutathione lyase family enzyme
MALHRMNSVTIGVPNVDATREFYRDFNLTETSPGRFASADGGEQLRIEHAPIRRVLEISIGAEDPDDIERVAAQLARLDINAERDETSISATDAGTGVRVTVEIAPKVEQARTPATPYNGPGRIEREGERSPRLRDDDALKAARPRKLGHVVLGSTAIEASNRFFLEGIGFKVSDEVKGAAYFMRCTTDHHNLLVQRAPVQFLHHTSWQVEDVDEIGLGAQALLAKDPGRHVWGFGRHHIGSNFFWYFRDPAGNFSEYYSDLDCIVDDQLWKPGVFEGMRALYSWGPPPPPSFLRPDDLAELMAGSHPAR